MKRGRKGEYEKWLSAASAEGLSSMEGDGWVRIYGGWLENYRLIIYNVDKFKAIPDPGDDVALYPIFDGGEERENN